MNIFKWSIAVILVVMASGCKDGKEIFVQDLFKKEEAKKAPVAKSKEVIYEVVQAKDGRLYKLNKVSGELYLIQGSEMFLVDDGIPILKIGQYYKMEDAQEGKNGFLMYLGEGKFEESRFGIRKTDL